MNYEELKTRMVERGQINWVDLALIPLVNSLRERREGIGMSQIEMAMACEVSLEEIQACEEYVTRPSLDLLDKMSVVLVKKGKGHKGNNPHFE